MKGKYNRAETTVKRLIWMGLVAVIATPLWAEDKPEDAAGLFPYWDAQLFAITKFGTEVVMGGAVQSDMAGFGEILSDEEILAVLGFIKASWPERIIARHNELNRRFEASQ